MKRLLLLICIAPLMFAGCTDRSGLATLTSIEGSQVELKRGAVLCTIWPILKQYILAERQNNTMVTNNLVFSNQCIKNPTAIAVSILADERRKNPFNQGYLYVMTSGGIKGVVLQDGVGPLH